MKKKKESRFKSVEELVKAFENYSGFCIELSEVDTREKLLNKIDEIQESLSNEVSDICQRYYQEASELMEDSDE